MNNMDWFYSGTAVLLVLIGIATSILRMQQNLIRQ